MPSLPTYLQNRTWQVTLAIALAATLFAFHAPIGDMIHEWSHKADYSHGFFVAPFALYLLWVRRERIPVTSDWPDWPGLLLIVMGVAMSFVGGRYNVAKEPLQGGGLILALAGVVVFQFGRYSLRWAWPAFLFLIFMVKWPDRFEMAFAFKLRQAAAQGSNFLLQMLGYPSFVAGPSGTIITVNDARLDVVHACSGLSMVLTFVAVAVAFAILVPRPPLDRVLIVLSSLPIAVIANIIRITGSSLVYIAGYHKLYKIIMHDLAGWLMMPLAIGMLWGVLKLLDWLFTIPEPPERDNIVRLATQTAAADWQMPPNGPPDLRRGR